MQNRRGCFNCSENSLKLKRLRVNQSWSSFRYLAKISLFLLFYAAESFFACMKREKLSHNYYDCVEDLRHDVSQLY